MFCMQHDYLTSETITMQCFCFYFLLFLFLLYSHSTFLYTDVGSSREKIIKCVENYFIQYREIIQIRIKKHICSMLNKYIHVYYYLICVGITKVKTQVTDLHLLLLVVALLSVCAASTYTVFHSNGD